jgi:hypothetical protein
MRLWYVSHTSQNRNRTWLFSLHVYSETPEYTGNITMAWDSFVTPFRQDGRLYRLEVSGVVIHTEYINGTDGTMLWATPSTHL